jgi:hypothetical protein
LKGTRKIRGKLNGACSISLQSDVLTAIEGRRFPEQTPTEADDWKWASCEVYHERKRKKCLDIVTPDIAGEAISTELERPGTYPAIAAVVLKCHGLIILCDALKLQNEGVSEDLFALQLATYCLQVHRAKKKVRARAKLSLPVAIVFTKCDCCPEAAQDPDKYAASRTPRLLQFCQDHFKRFAFSASHVVGASGEVVDRQGQQMHVPLHVQPHGIVEPFKWIMNLG